MAEMPKPGCYVDSHWGQYAIARAIEVATELGWEDAEASELAARHLASMGPSTAPGLDVDEFERLVHACDEAEAWLNDNRAPLGYGWEWNDGDFGMYPESDDA